MPSNTSDTISWESEPNGRGTFSILGSCVITLTLCVWTAVHLNVPEEHTPFIQRYKTKLYWLLMGVFAPELVVYLAWTQWSAAKSLTTKIRGVLEENVSPAFPCEDDSILTEWPLSSKDYLEANQSVNTSGQ